MPLLNINRRVFILFYFLQLKTFMYSWSHELNCFALTCHISVGHFVLGNCELKVQVNHAGSRKPFWKWNTASVFSGKWHSWPLWLQRLRGICDVLATEKRVWSLLKKWIWVRHRTDKQTEQGTWIYTYEVCEARTWSLCAQSSYDCCFLVTKPYTQAETCVKMIIW